MYRRGTSRTSFIAPQASLVANSSYKSCASRCTRRQALHATACSLISLAVRPKDARALDVTGLGDAIPAEDYDKVRGSVKGDVTFTDFVAALRKGDVKRVWFFGTFNEYCCFEASDGVLRHVGDGYPVEQARSPESPLHIMAKVRDSNVPYYVAPVSGKYLRR